MEKERETVAEQAQRVGLKAINPMIFLVAVVLLCAAASYIVPAGSYDRVMDAATKREIVAPDSFHYVERNPATLFGLLLSLTLGMQNAASVIFFLMIIGGMFAILNGTGAINAGMAGIVRKMRGREMMMIPVCMIVFGCGSCFCGSFEEFLAFVPLVLACCLTMGFDSLTAVGIDFGSAAAGYGGAMTNAFTVGVAQGISGLPMFSGIALRGALFVALMAVTIAYVMWHAARVRRNPASSSTYEIDRVTARETALDVDDIPDMTGRHKLVLLVLVAGVAYTVYGIITEGFYIDELAAVFLATGVVGGVIGGSNFSKICDDFTRGCCDMMFPCLMIGLANAAVIILKEANIMDTIIHWLAGTLNGLHKSLLACGMFVVQDLFNVLVPSGSGQAAITMPIMAPLADMLGITRQTAVLAFQLGDSFTNVVAPTGGEILAALAMCNIPYGKWLKYLAPLFCLWCLVAFAFLIFATQIGYGPF